VSSLQTPGQAKTYNRIKLAIGILSSILTVAVMMTLVLSGYSTMLASSVRGITSQTYVAVLLFAAAVGVLQSVVTLPLGFYSGYILEHRFQLSNQTCIRWIWEQLKGLLVGAPLAAIVLVLLYFCLEHYGNEWWLPLGILLTVFSVLLARLAPVLLLPLFYQMVPLEEGPLKERILALCRTVNLRFDGVYTFDLSKNTKKANAALTGIGRARRIILGDTLVGEFTEEEIETVFAHELGHHHLKHLPVRILTGTVSTFAGLFIASRLFAWSLPLAGFSGLTDIGALPLLGLWLSLFALVTMPLGNVLSRRHERQADASAVKITRNARAFASALRKLASQNLADPDPQPLVEFLFYSHPSIGRRLKAVESVAQP
jgi:STE24 endopeptidase